MLNKLLVSAEENCISAKGTASGKGTRVPRVHPVAETWSTLGVVLPLYICFGWGHTYVTADESFLI